MYYDWTPQVDTRTICLPAAPQSITSSWIDLPRGTPEVTCQGLPLSRCFHYEIHARIHLNDISVICPAISQKLGQYYDSVTFLEYICLSVRWIFGERSLPGDMATVLAPLRKTFTGSISTGRSILFGLRCCCIPRPAVASIAPRDRMELWPASFVLKWA
jgi:hypothetical protein